MMTMKVGMQRIFPNLPGRKLHISNEKLNLLTRKDQLVSSDFHLFNFNETQDSLIQTIHCKYMKILSPPKKKRLDMKSFQIVT